MDTTTGSVDPASQLSMSTVSKSELIFCFGLC
jgi:hypothetical protein